jgi:S1-C subfamily serine protease
MDIASLAQHLLFTTVFIATTSADGNATGTGFLYEARTSEIQKEIFLVTNKHVVADADIVSLRFIAATDREMSAPKWGEAYTFNIRHPENVFYGHDDPDVDVAVALCTPWLGSLYEN